MKNKKNKGLVWGIVSICTGWLFPIMGIIAGSIALVRANSTKGYIVGGIGLGESILFWAVWTLVGLGGGI